MAKLPVRNEAISPEELAVLVRLAKRSLRTDDATRGKLQAAGVNIVPCNFYSDIPSIMDIANSFELRNGPAPYRDPSVFDAPVMADFLTTLTRYSAEFDPPVDGSVERPDRYFWRNPAFSFSDAMAYYSVLRHAKPKVVVEIGSGYSTLVAREALRRNGVGELISIEPFPMPWLADLPGITLVTKPVQDIQADFFNEHLGDGDVLFIDSTHTVKAGSDCLQIYLRLLPALRANLMVHAHDIYLPFPLPRAQFDRHIYWTEQYLLYAYLLDNPRARLLYGSQYHHAFDRAALDRFMQGRWASGGASVWFSLEGVQAGSNTSL